MKILLYLLMETLIALGYSTKACDLAARCAKYHPEFLNYLSDYLLKRGPPTICRTDYDDRYMDIVGTIWRRFYFDVVDPPTSIYVKRSNRP